MLVPESNIIELMGPPGVGKSTLYHEVCKKWSPDSNWIYFDMLMASPTPSIRNFSNWLAYRYKKYTGKRLHGTLSLDYGLTFVKEHKELANFCWQLFTEDPIRHPIEQRYRNIYLLFDHFSGYQAIASRQYSKPCLVEEGLFQKSFLVYDDKQRMAAILDEYCELVPLPKAVVAIYTDDVDLIVKQIKHRKKIIASHQNKDHEGLMNDTKKWLLFTQLVLEKLQSKGVHTICIDGSKSLQEKAIDLQSVLKSLPR